MLEKKQIHIILILSSLILGFSIQADSLTTAREDESIGGSTFQNNPFRSINRSQKKNIPQFESPLFQGRVLAEAAVTSYDQ